MLGKGILFACCLAAAVVSQESRPESRAASRPAVEYRTPSGFRVRLAPVDLPGEVAVILGIQGAGILAEPAGTPHLAHISEHAIFHSLGEDSQLGKLVAEWQAKGMANAETLPELMYFDLQPPADVPLRLAIQAQYQRFVGGGYAPPSVMEREIPRALSEVTTLEASRTDKLDFLGKFAWSAFTQIALRGATAVPFKARSEEITWAMVSEFRERTFYPGAGMLTVVGDFDPEALRPAIDPGWTPKQRKNQAEPRPKLRPGAVQGTWDVASHQFFMAWPAPPPSDPAHPALSVFSHLMFPRLLMSPALSKAARQSVGLHADVGGMFVIQVPLKRSDDGPNAAAAIAASFEALSKEKSAFRSLKAAQASVRSLAGITSGEIQYPPRLSRKILAHANLELARMRATLAWDQSPEDYCARADKVTAADIQAAVKTWLAPDKAAIVTVTGKE
jgi:predicted Zn-dependent peptidase